MFLSICTPTYNRAYTLKRVYKSLILQSLQNFEWIIVDDGSKDNTEQIVNNFIAENKITIRYVFQPNQGKHIALNKGVEIANGELFTCLDSDDWLYNDAIEKINSAWLNLPDNKDIVGIIALDTYKNGNIVGKKLPNNVEQANWIDLKFKYKLTGDKDYYFRTNELKEVYFPSYKNNKHMPPSYQYFMLSKKNDFHLLNVPTKYVEYLEDGISKNKFNKYIVAPDNFARYRFDIMDLIPTFKRKLMNAIHLNSSLFLGKIKLKPKAVKNKILVFVTKLPGFILSLYIKINVNKDKNVSHRIE